MEILISGMQQQNPPPQRSIRRAIHSGKKIRILPESRQAAGSHTITFDAEDFPSGIYFYTMTANNYSCTLKMTLLK